jgi:hypothetical protein
MIIIVKMSFDVSIFLYTKLNCTISSIDDFGISIHPIGHSSPDQWLPVVVVAITISAITHFLRKAATNPLGRLLMNLFTMFLWHTPTIPIRLVSAFLVWNILTFSPRNLDTNLFRYIHADLLSILLRNIPACIVGVVHTGALIRNPSFVIASSLPVVLAILFVLCGAFCLSVTFILCVTLFIILSCTLIFVHGVADLPCGGYTHFSLQGLALVYILSGADVVHCFYVLCVPHGGVLNSALNRSRRLSHWSRSSSILWS